MTVFTQGFGKYFSQALTPLFSYIFAGFIAFGASASDLDENVFWKNYKELISDKNYKQASAQLDTYWDKSAPLYRLFKAELIVLGGDHDLCEAVDILERIPPPVDGWARVYLDFIYADSYVQISAIEGNRKSLYDVGREYYKKYEDLKDNFRDMAPYLLRQAYIYNKTALELNLSDAHIQNIQLEHEFKVEEMPLPEDVIEFRSVICPIRSQ